MYAAIPFCVPQEQDGWTLWDFLKAQGVSSGYIRKVKRMQPGITLLGEHKNTDWRVHAGDSYQLPVLEEEETSVKGQQISVNILYESDCALVVEKPAGMAVHPTLGYPDGTLANAVVGVFEARGEKIPFRPVNRLDVGTTGLVLAAKSRLAAVFLSRSAVKEYTALAVKKMPLGKGVVTAPIARCEDSIIKRCVAPQGKPSTTYYEVLDAAGGLSLVRCIPATGRTHQIRVHFAFMGHPLAGDDLYGERCKGLERHALHCSAIQFEEPDKRQVRVESGLAADLCRLAEENGIDWKRL